MSKSRKQPQTDDLRTRERPTLKTIAQLTGLAVPTVSRALSDAPDIGEKTKERVREVAHEIGYRRDRAGLRLRTGKTNVIALIMGANRDVMNHTAQLIASIASELRGTPYHLIMMLYFDDQEPLDPVKYVVETGSADGVILNRIQPDDPRIAYLRQNNFPFVTHGRTADCHRDPYFDFDNGAFGRVAVEMLARRGRRRILLIAPPLDQNYAQHLVKGCKAEAMAQGVQFEVLDGTTSDETVRQVSPVVAGRLAVAPDIDGIIVASPAAAMGATTAVEGLGRTLGNDVDIVAKEAIPFLKAFRDQIMIVHEDTSEAGAFLARALMRAIDEPTLPPMQRLDVPQDSQLRDAAE